MVDLLGNTLLLGTIFVAGSFATYKVLGYLSSGR